MPFFVLHKLKAPSVLKGKKPKPKQKNNPTNNLGKSSCLYPELFQPSP